MCFVWCKNKVTVIKSVGTCHCKYAAITNKTAHCSAVGNASILIVFVFYSKLFDDYIVTWLLKRVSE